MRYKLLQYGVGWERNEVRVRRVYGKGAEEAWNVRKVVEGCRSSQSQKCSMSCFSSLSENRTKTPDGAGWVGRLLGRNRSKALGLGCWDKSGIGVVAATFLLRGCERKKKEGCQKKIVGCSCQTAGSCGRKSGSHWEFRRRPEMPRVA